LYGRSAKYYDAIYSWKNYEKESAKLHRLIQKHKRSKGKDLPDVACGTGGHLAHLKNMYHAVGLDISEKMLRFARKKHPDIVFHRGDMTSFKFNKQFDAITCLFSAIGHMKTEKKLGLAIQNMSQHLKPGGVLIVEPWFTPQQWHSGSLHANFVNQLKLKIARMNISKTRGTLSILDEHHLVATPEQVEHFVERFEMGLFTRDQYLGAFRSAKLKVTHDPKGIMGRGLYIGTRPPDN